MDNDKTQKGCELCGDFPVRLLPRCHPTAPLRIEITQNRVLVCYCYLPECNREVARFQLPEEKIWIGK
jgi:hypothetical protein